MGIWMCTTCFFLRKLTKMLNLILCFLEIPRILFIWGLKKVVRLKQCPLYGFLFRNAEREAYRKQTRSNVSVLLEKVSAL